MVVKFTKYGGFSYDPIKQYGRGSKAPKKKKEPEPVKKEEKFGIMRDERGVATGFTTPSGEVFLGQFNKEEEAKIRARYEPEQAKATARQEAIKAEGTKGRIKEFLGQDGIYDQVPSQALAETEQQDGGILSALSGRMMKEAAQEAGGEIMAGTLPIGVGGGWKIGGKLFANPKKAVQVGTSTKNSVLAGITIKKIRDASVAMIAGAFGIEKLSSFVFNRKVDDQKQALNTLGQITSTIIGDSTTGAGDYRKGLEELRHIRSEILYLESAIKSGTIAKATLKFRGKTIDINADIYDQLATIDEGIRDIQSFALTGQFPELTEFELQGMIRELEAEGYLEPVDLTTARREMK